MTATTWICHAKPAALGRTCGHVNTTGTASTRFMGETLEVCAGCGCTRKASDDRKGSCVVITFQAKPQACEECGKAMLLGPLGESDFVPLVCVICYAYNNPRYALGRDAVLDADIAQTKQLQEAEACARGDLLPYDPTVGGRGCAGCKRIFGKGLNQHVTAARRRFAKLERKKAAPCKACEARTRAGFEGQCPACAGERARNELAQERAAVSGKKG